jgi:hypothetical protein
VHPAGWDGIEIRSQRGNQRLTFTGLHFCDVAKVQGPTTHQLNVKVPKTERPLGCLAHSGKGFRQQVIEGFASTVASAQLVGLTAELIVAQVSELILEVIDRRGQGRKFAQGAAFSETEKAL